MTNLASLIGLIISTILILILFIFIDKMKSQGQVRTAFAFMLICLLICCTGLMLQITFSGILGINPIYFDYFVYIGTCFLPVAFFFTSLIFAKTKITLGKKYLTLFTVPIISLIILWTNGYHHLFFVNYSINISDGIVGKYFYVHTVYTYLLFIIGFLYLIRYSIKNSGFFSRQSILIIIGSLIPIIINLFGTSGAIPMTIYFTPMSFSFAMLFFALAIFKFDFLKVSPIALQKVVDRMSDSYVIVNDENVVTDFNGTFLSLFHVQGNQLRNRNISDLFKEYKQFGIKSDLILESVKKSRETSETVVLDEQLPSIGKYFHIEINNIKNKNVYLGTLILLKDVTQHNLDIQTIRQNQDMLVEKERLATLGQMIGGIAHNLKTPIMSIAGAAEGLSDLIKEYDSSIEDPNVNFQDHHEIAHDMFEWIEKMRTHLSYMSDVITAIKGQAVTFSNESSKDFTVEDLLKYVDILMKHELKNAIVNLNYKVEINPKTLIQGNINSLVQVVNNIISNAIQAYNGKPDQNIDFSVYKESNKLILKIKDYAGGLPKKVQDKLFKEMITTKGKNGTGLGLFMSYSNIKAHFNGSMRYETESGAGTAFYIELPL